MIFKEAFRKDTAKWWLVWLVLHIVGIGFILLRDAIHGRIDGTIPYYEEGITKVDGLSEYPPLNIWYLKFVHAISFGHFDVVFPLMIAVLSFFFSVFIIARLDIEVAKWWMLIDGIMATLIAFRLDILVVIPVFFAFYCVYISRNFWAGAFLMVATWAKVWPLVLYTALVSNIRDRRTWIHASGAVAAGLVLTVATVLFNGLDALITPLTYQSDRGLQAESLWATPFYIMQLFGDNWSTHYAESESFEILGPGADTVGVIAGYALNLFCVAAAIFAAYCLFTKKWTPLLSIRFATFVAFGIIAINKVFSPQYLYWVVPMMIILAAVDKSRDWSRILLALTICAAVTMLIYPIDYESVTLMRPGMSVVLILRNFLVFGIFIALIRALRESAASESKS
ncbi:MAG: hypothetical protein Q3972_03200 [Corynebacterium sp.]|nr:hypothetical protein [Corynebacterium sp.]